MQDADAPSLRSLPKAKLVDLDFLRVSDHPVLGPPPCVLSPRDTIMDMLQDSQKDLDLAV